MDPKDREPMAQLTQTPPPERSEPVRLIAMLAGDNDAVKNEGSQVEDRCNCSQLSSSFDPRLIAVSEGGVWILG